MNGRLKEYFESNIITSEEKILENISIEWIAEIYKNAKLINRHTEADRIFSEILTNCNEWWINETKNINPEEKLYCIFFEYDYIYSENLDAVAYGINIGDFRKLQLEPYDIGLSYDFASGFYACPGFTIKTFSPLSNLGIDIWEETLLENGLPIAYTPEWEAIVKYYKNITYSIVHNALELFVKTDAFQKINKHDSFQLLIQEHDMGESQPVYFV
ncbi:hypothetical protein [Runella sp.]|uniref:hypothetical protein n=1 Tax=Runella sp. TaxID=1960881 RepID=UPI003D13D891